MVNGSSIIIPHREAWQHQAIRATGGNTTLLGCYVLAVCGWQHGRKPPRFGSKAVIDENGVAFAHMQDINGAMHRMHCLGPVQDITDSFRGLADHLKLSDDDRVAMFEELKKWFAHDARANQSNEERGIP